MKLYDLVVSLLKQDTKYRESDKELIWRVFEVQGIVVDGVIKKDRFMRAKSTESIRRCRQKVQENKPELASKSEYRKLIEKQKGTHVYRETIFNDDGTVSYRMRG